MSLEMWTLAIAIFTAIACALSGALLVVKREAMVSEGLSHAVLPGIILAFVVLRDRTSPLLIVTAAAMGLAMVMLVEALRRTRLVDGDASLGVVFSAMFSGGILLANIELNNTHFHAHCIIDGNLALAPLDTLSIGAVEWGPKAFYVMLGVTILLLAFILVAYKELKLMLFDPALAANFRLRPGLLHTVWLGLVSIAAVAAFEAAGSILVVALMIAPPAAAQLLTNRLEWLLPLSCLLGIASAMIGYQWGLWLDVSPTGPMATASGLLFLAVFLLAPRQGMLSRWRRHRRQQRWLQDHVVLSRVADGGEELSFQEVAAEFYWPIATLNAALRRLTAAALVRRDGDRLIATPAGRDELERLESLLR